MGAILAWAARFRVAIILGIVVVLAIVSFRVVNGITEYRLVVPLDSADGLYPGSDVLIAGAKAGTVRDITLDGTQTLVTIAIAWIVHRPLIGVALLVGGAVATYGVHRLLPARKLRTAPVGRPA